MSKKRVHFILQGKGGVGKSLISALLAQYAIEKNSKSSVLAIDTDPINKTLVSFEELNAVSFEIMKEGSIDIRRFDEMMEMIIEANVADVVVDNGASSFISLCEYIAQTDALKALSSDFDIEVYIHTVVTGGQAMAETAEGLLSLTNHCSDDANIVLWLNEFFGDLTFNTSNGDVDWEDSKIYKDVASSLHSEVVLPRQNAQLQSVDIHTMLSHHLTFDQIAVSNSKHFGIFTKKRLKDYKDVIFRQLSAIVPTEKNTPKKGKSAPVES